MATQEQIFIVKWMPDGDDINGCKYLRGDTNRAYETLEEAEERAMHIANEARREVGVFALESVFRPPLNVERVDVKKKARRKKRK
jgi:hypothetical protein